jgi:TRAP-type C4-dicarboxylate transport system permease small subunit
MQQPEEPHGEAAPASDALTRWNGLIAILGGGLALGVAGLVMVSVLGRWIFNAPIDGDFEFVKMATAIAIFAWLPYTQARRANVFVDTFTGRLSKAARNRLDAFWDIAYALFMAFLAVALLQGTLEAVRSGETTMQRQLLVWPSIALSMLLCAALAVTGALTARKLLLTASRP